LQREGKKKKKYCGTRKMQPSNWGGKSNGKRALPTKEGEKKLKRTLLKQVDGLKKPGYESQRQNAQTLKGQRRKKRRKPERIQKKKVR